MELNTASSTKSTVSLPAINATWQRQLALLMMILAIISVYWPRNSGALSTAVLPKGTYRYHTDLDYWTKTERARTVSAISPFDLDHDLLQTPLQVGDWKGVDKPETNQEVIILLDPEQYVLRLYQNSKGQYVWLSMIGARSSQAFHPPDVCYDADGWTWQMDSYPTQLNDGSQIYGLYLEAEKTVATQPKPIEHVVYYFYLFPNDQRNLSDGIVLFKLTSARYGTVKETLEMQADFVRQFFLSTQG